MFNGGSNNSNKRRSVLEYNSDRVVRNRNVEAKEEQFGFIYDFRDVQFPFRLDIQEYLAWDMSRLETLLNSVLTEFVQVYGLNNTSRVALVIEGRTVDDLRLHFGTGFLNWSEQMSERLLTGILNSLNSSMSAADQIRVHISIDNRRPVLPIAGLEVKGVFEELKSKGLASCTIHNGYCLWEGILIGMVHKKLNVYWSSWKVYQFREEFGVPIMDDIYIGAVERRLGVTFTFYDIHNEYGVLYPSRTREYEIDSRKHFIFIILKENDHYHAMYVKNKRECFGKYRQPCLRCGELTELTKECLSEHGVQCMFNHQCKGVCSLCKCMKQTWPCIACAIQMCDECYNEHNCFIPQCHKSVTMKRVKTYDEYMVCANERKDSYEYYIYDFECYEDGNRRHVPYLMCVKKLRGSITNFGNGVYSAQFETLSFFGVNALIDGVTWMLEQEKSCFMAHNGRGYDSIFIRNCIVHEMHLRVVEVRRGLKLLNVFVPEKKVHFRDTLSFIPCALRYMGKEFGITELKKGFYPYLQMTGDRIRDENWNVELQLEWFSAKDQAEADFESWYVEASRKEFNLKEEAIEYCISDVCLLAQVCEEFWSSTEGLTKCATHVNGINPFQFITLPSAVMYVFMNSHLREQSIGNVDRYRYLNHRKSLLWLSSIRDLDEVCLFIEVSGVWVTGLDIAKNSVYLYLICGEIGCDKCFTGKEYNFRQQRSMEQLFATFQANMIVLQQSGYEIISCRECESNISGKDQSIIPFTIWKNLCIDPRESYKGGKVECFAFAFKGEISMVDYVSEYPTILLGESVNPMTQSLRKWYLPYGGLLEIKGNQPLCVDKVGIVKCEVLCPRDVYAPFLSFKCEYEGEVQILYGLCRTCMETRLDEDCNHSEEERFIYGTWTIPEMNYALSIGYTIRKIYSQLVYEEKKDDLFQSFIRPIMIEKILRKKSGIVDENNEFTSYGIKVKEYASSLGYTLTPDDFSNTPAKRTVAKLMMNAITGKFGQREDYESLETLTCKQHKDIWKILRDKSKKITFVEFDSNGIISIYYETNPVFNDAFMKKNDLIVAMITSYGRIMVNEVEQRLGRKVIYGDTDSAFHMKLENPPYQVGFRPGDLELEVPTARNWVAFGPKSYSYEKENKDFVAKYKGFALDIISKQQFHPDSMREHLFNGEYIQTQKTDFRTIEKDGVIEKKSVYQEKNLRFRKGMVKRRLLEPDVFGNVFSLPFGYNQNI